MVAQDILPDDSADEVNPLIVSFRLVWVVSIANMLSDRTGSPSRVNPTSVVMMGELDGPRAKTQEYAA